MRTGRKFSSGSRESGSALLIAIFALLLISVVGLALVVSTGTDSALAGNYRNSTGAYYAAVAGLEEARGRLLWRNPDFINKTNGYSTLFSGQGIPTFGVTDVVYILNPVGGETVDPPNGSSLYADTQYATEMGWPLSGANVHTSVASVSPMSGLPGPAYKWVRINPVTEKGFGLDINNSGGSPNSFTPLYYNGNGLNLNSLGNEALELTSFVVMPDKSTRLLQYVVVPSSLTLTFPAALTLAGNGVSYQGPNSGAFYINGIDPTTGRSCATPPAAAVPAIGITNLADQATVQPGTSSNPGNYTGYSPPAAPPTPSIAQVTLPSTLQKPSQVEQFIQMLTQNSDVQISKAPAVATGSDLPSGMSPTNPLMVVVNGDLDLNAWHNTGYGILLVTGSLNYDPDASWEGIVLVLGKGVVTGSRMGSGRFDGAFMVAQSRDPVTGNVLPDPNLGAASVTFASNMGGFGIYYNTCTILQAQAPTSYRVLSFREITQ